MQFKVTPNTINRIVVHVFYNKILHEELICILQEFQEQSERLALV